MKIQFVEGASKFYKMYSIWFMALLAVLPDIWNLAISTGLLEQAGAPEQLSYLLKIVAFLGGVARLVKQKALSMPAPEDSGGK